MTASVFGPGWRAILAGLSLSLFVTAASPLVGVDDAIAGRGKARQEVSQERKGKRPKVITKTFTRDEIISLPDRAEGGPGNPYPSTLRVSGLKQGKIVDLDLTLRGFEHEIPPDVDILLVKEGKNPTVVQVMGDAGDITRDDVPFLTLDDEAALPLPFFERLSAGRFQPTDYDQGGLDDDEFPAPAPAPAPGDNAALAAFDGLDPNGVWRLYVVDARNQGGGSIDGWELTMEIKVKSRKRNR